MEIEKLPEVETGFGTKMPQHSGGLFGKILKKHLYTSNLKIILSQSRLDRIVYHLEEAEEKLSSARLLLESGYFKDAVSRAYYCMYNAARALLLTKDISPKTHKASTHSLVISTISSRI